MLKLYSTGCSRNTRTIPLHLGSPIAQSDSPIMDWSFTEILGIDDDIAMEVDFAVLDDKWAYWCIANKKESNNSWSFTFTLCALKTYMIKDKRNDIIGMWNKTPTWIDKYTITPAISDYRREKEINLPGYMSDLWVEIMYVLKTGNHEYVLKIMFPTMKTIKNGSVNQSTPTVEDVITQLGTSVLNIGGTIYNIDGDAIMNISASKLCPYYYKEENSLFYLTNESGTFYQGGNASLGFRRGQTYFQTGVFINTPEFTTLSPGTNSVSGYTKRGNITQDSILNNDLLKKFGLVRVMGENNVVGELDRAQMYSLNYRYVADSTGWMLHLYGYSQDNPYITIPSSYLPWMNNTYSSYKVREMEYDRAERDRMNQYAKDNAYSDAVKGTGNGMLSGAFAGTHSSMFGGITAGMTIGTSIISSSLDMQNQIANNNKAQQNKEAMMRKGLNTVYNSGYGERIRYASGYCFRVDMPVDWDNMAENVYITGYSCNGVKTAILDRGFIQGMPIPSDEIKGTIKNILINELQSGMWII